MLKKGIKKIRNIFFPLFLGILSTVLILPNPDKIFASELDQRWEELTKIQLEIDEHNREIEKSLKETNTLKKSIAVIDRIIKETELEIEKTKKLIKKNREELKKIDEEIADKELELVKLEDALDSSLSLLYEEEENSFIEVLFSSFSFSEALDRAEYLSALSEYIDQSIANIADLKGELEEKREEYQDKEEELQILKEQFISEKLLQEEKKEAKKELLRKTQGQEEKFKELLEKSQEAFRIAELELVRLKKIARKRRDKGADDSGPVNSITGFITPLKHGRITYGGDFMDPHYPFGIHKGIDIVRKNPVKDSKALRAVGDGKIVKIVDGLGNTFPWRKIFGNYVLIKHQFEKGRVLFSLYAHLQPGIGWKRGDKIKRGQIVGIMGNSGFSTNPHLHFEIRVCETGCQVDPKSFLPPRPW